MPDYTLDGLRGLAAMLVFYQHISQSSLGIGMLGVYCFFILSAYLLSQPFINANKSTFLDTATTFYIRRALRILPMYYVATLIFYWHLGRDQEWLRQQTLFIFSDTVMWTVKQEVVFYALLPLLMLPLCLKYFSYSGLFWVCIASSIAAWKWLPADILDLGHRYWQKPGALIPFFIAIFLGGISVAALERLPTLDTIKKHTIPRIAEDGIMLGLFICAVLLTLYLPARLAHNPQTWEGHIWWSWLLSTMFFWVIMRPNQSLGRFLRWPPLRALGVVSYSFYLLHIVVKRLLVKYGVIEYANMGWEAYFLTGSISYVLSCITYCAIERPFIACFRSKHPNR